MSAAKDTAANVQIADLAEPMRELLAERDQLRQDVLTLALRLHFEDDDMNAPETREVLARWRPAVNAEIARRTS